MGTNCCDEELCIVPAQSLGTCNVKFEDSDRAADSSDRAWSSLLRRAVEAASRKVVMTVRLCSEEDPAGSNGAQWRGPRRDELLRRGSL